MNDSHPSCLPKILHELHKEHHIKVLTKQSPLSYKYDKLLPFLFKDGLPEILGRHLTNEEFKSMQTVETEQKLKLWDSIKSFFNRKKGRQGSF